MQKRRRGVAVVPSLKDCESGTGGCAFLRGVVQGFMDLEDGREINLADVKKRLGVWRSERLLKMP